MAVLRGAVEQGVNHIDTAQFYGVGAVNELIRAALRPIPEHVVLVSKVGAEHDERAGLVAAQRPAQLRASVQANLATLGVERLAVVNLRRPDAPPGLLAEAALPAGIACVQNAYSVLDRTGEPVLDLCREHGIAWVPFFPLGSAFPGVAKVTEHPAVRTAAAALGAAPAQVGLTWLLAHHPHTLLIPGTANPAHLKDNIAAGSVRLDPDTITTLDRLALG